MCDDLDSVAINNFKEYLRIPSVQPECDLRGCVRFVERQAASLGLAAVVHEVAVGSPLVVISWAGRYPGLPSLLLSSHMDVVPVYADQWTRPPFGAEEDDSGNIYARGAQDMKCVGVQYLEAVRRLMARGYSPERSVHVCFTPDEEIGSRGMRLFVETEAFRKLNVGCVLDEGVPFKDDRFSLLYGELTNFALEITCSGTPGHGSLLHEGTAGQKLAVVVDLFMQKRAEEVAKVKDVVDQLNGHATSINLTVVEGGVQTNVVPPELKVVFDCRLALDVDVEEFERWVADVCRQAGEGVSVKYLGDKLKTGLTKLDQDNPWWTALKTQFDGMGMAVHPIICPGGTDSRYIRNIGIPAFGFSPINNTEIKAHDHDEYLNRHTFLKGIDIYCNIISALGKRDL